MHERLIELVDDIFVDVPFSEYSEKIKDEISKSFFEIYDSLISEGLSETKAMGEIMYKYGSLEDAVKLAGFSENDVKKLEKHDGIIADKEIKRTLRKVRRITLLSSIGILGFLNFVLNGISQQERVFIILTCLTVIFTVVCLNKYVKLVKANKYENVKFNKKTADFLQLRKDTCKKRLINSFLVGVLGLSLMIMSATILIVFSGMKIREFRVVAVVNNLFITGGIFLCVINSMRLYWLDNIFKTEDKKEIRRFFSKMSILTVSYWAVSALVIILCIQNKVSRHNIFITFFVAFGLFVVAIFTYSFFARKKLVSNNFVINVRLVAGLVLIVFSIFSYRYMQMDSWIIQPYISTISSVNHDTHQIDYDDKTGVYTIVSNDDDFKILQLTDIHLGGSTASADKDLKALDAVYTLIKYTEPDLVIVTGDLVFPLGIMSYSFNNYAPVVQFASFMRNIGVPWAFTFGNHDTEAVASNSVEDLTNLYQELSYDGTQSLLYPKVQPDVYGRNNQLIKIVGDDGNLIQALFLLDSNSYTGEKINDYDYIHDDQVEWYADQVESLSAEAGETISSMMFFHIPITEYKTSYELYEQGSDEVNYYYGKIGEKNNAISTSPHYSQIFNKAVELGSTKAMFCGHDHYNNTSIEYEGIRLTYGMSIDYLVMSGIANKTEQRGGTLITLHSDSSYDIEPVRLSNIQQKVSR